MSADAPRDLLEQAEEALHPLSAIRGWDRENLFQLIRALCQRVRAAEKSLHDSEMECLGMQGRVERAEAESARLREALEKIACHQDAYHAECVEWAISHHGAHRPECAIAVAVLGRPSEPRT